MKAVTPFVPFSLSVPPSPSPRWQCRRWYEVLQPVEEVHIPLLHSLGLDGGRIGAGVGLCEGKSRRPLPARNPRQVFLFLGRGSIDLDPLGTNAVVRPKRERKQALTFPNSSLITLSPSVPSPSPPNSSGMESPKTPSRNLLDNAFGDLFFFFHLLGNGFKFIFHKPSAVSCIMRIFSGSSKSMGASFLEWLIYIDG